MREVQREYQRLRRKGWTASEAFRAAKVNVVFEGLAREGYVALRVVPEIDIYDDSYIDTWSHLTEAQREAARKEVHERIHREGCWIVVSSFRQDPLASWLDVDEVGGFIGEDYVDSGYDVDLKEAALRALREEESLRNKYN